MTAELTKIKKMQNCAKWFLFLFIFAHHTTARARVAQHDSASPQLWLLYFSVCVCVWWGDLSVFTCVEGSSGVRRLQDGLWCASGVAAWWRAASPGNAYLSCSVRETQKHCGRNTRSTDTAAQPNSLPLPFLHVSDFWVLFDDMWLTITSMSFSLSIAFWLARRRDKYEVNIMLRKQKTLHVTYRGEMKEPHFYLCTACLRWWSLNLHSTCVACR